MSCCFCSFVFIADISLLATAAHRRAQRELMTSLCSAVISVAIHQLRYAPTEVGSTRIPGPIVVATFTFLTYLPFAVAGFALITASISAFALAVILSAEKETLPTGT